MESTKYLNYASHRVHGSEEGRKRFAASRQGDQILRGLSVILTQKTLLKGKLSYSSLILADVIFLTDSSTRIADRLNLDGPDDNHEASEWALSSVGFQPGEGLVLLEIQEETLRFLLRCCQSLMQDAPIAELMKDMPISFESPYRAPAHIDLARLKGLAVSKRSAAEEHIWAMREDPGYFHEVCIEERFNQIQMSIKNEDIKKDKLLWILGELWDKKQASLFGLPNLIEIIRRSNPKLVGLSGKSDSNLILAGSILVSGEPILAFCVAPDSFLAEFYPGIRFWPYNLIASGMHFNPFSSLTIITTSTSTRTRTRTRTGTITGTITRPAPPALPYNPHVLQSTHEELHRLRQQLHFPQPSPEFPPILLYILTDVLAFVHFRQRLLRTIDMKESIAYNIPDNLAESPQMAYKYEALANPQSFRLLTLEPGYETDHIKCEITVLAMAEAPQYEALSYVWGSSERTHTITCNYMPLKVTASLDTVLRVLRKPSGSRIIWIDQICIDQDNIPERSEQVQVMRDIYSRAHQVLMWLGKDDLSEASLAMDLINDIASLSSSSSHPPTSLRFPTDIELRERGLPLRGSPSWNALEKFLDLPYFTRIWIIQEIAVAHAVIVMWGNSKIPWVTVKCAWAAALQLNLHVTDPQAVNPSPSLALFHLPALFQPVRPWDVLLRSSQSYYDATDPRDRVFALIGLADDSIPLKANYQMTTSEVYAQATIHLIKTSEDLFVLSFAHDASPNSTSEFPSWAMSWSKTDSNARSLSRIGFHASKESTPQLKEATDWSILMLGGFSFDNVEHIGIPIRYENHHLDLVESFQLLRRHADKLGGVYGNGLIETFISTLTIGSRWNTEGDGVSFGQSREYVLSGFASFIANRSLINIERSVTEGVTPSCQRELLELLSLTVEADPNMKLNRDLSQDTRNWARDSMVACHAPNQEAAITATKLINLVLDVFNPEVFRSFELAMIFADDRKLFITSQGRLGIGPLCLEPTDIICVLFGGNSLYALRPIPGTGEHYFLGECYIHGLMNGDAMESYQQGEFHVAQGLLRACSGAAQTTQSRTAKVSADSTLELAVQHGIQPTFALGKCAFKTISTLFHNAGQGDQPGEVSWSDFLYSMVVRWVCPAEAVWKHLAIHTK
ncbi:uncharacterized protein PAC_15631 [Phialocephala subalpina]|uniref:Heterokaryon incompatibility domain-containing protein n=1 Tax=Phialocephala subalpina TaxID=576137 RepID=A0A1L7XKZ4_9HELO|nr:uncharacterized protein PAC_15631 [Phialocephala subalpina]